MSYTAAQLIIRAYYLSTIVSRDFEVVTGGQKTDGLAFLNDLLGMKSANIGLIPYFKSYSFNAVPGQEEYFIENLVSPETFTFFIDNVRYNTMMDQRKRYFGTPRAENINSLPFKWHIEREKGGSRLYVYFKPDKNYPMVIWGKFGLDEITDINYDLLQAYDRFYIEYLRYALAEKICEEEGVGFSATRKLRAIERQLRDLSPKDLSLTKLSTLDAPTGLNYADINLGHGWRPY